MAAADACTQMPLGHSHARFPLQPAALPLSYLPQLCVIHNGISVFLCHSSTRVVKLILAPCELLTIVLTNIGRAFTAAQRVSAVIFIVLTVAYSFTNIPILGVLSLISATLIVVFSLKTGGWVKVARSIGTGLMQVGLLTLILELVRIRVMFLGLATAYWITLAGILLNVGLIILEGDDA